MRVSSGAVSFRTPTLIPVRSQLWIKFFNSYMTNFMQETYSSYQIWKLVFTINHRNKPMLIKVTIHVHKIIATNIKAMSEPHTDSGCVGPLFHHTVDQFLHRR